MRQYTDINIYKKIGVIPTDTIYGIVCQALDAEMVERIYKIKGRQPEKPFIILISKIQDLELFGIFLTDEQIKILESLWPNKISIVLACQNDKYNYLHRGTNSLAFRLPKDDQLRRFLDKTGPLVAPSANPEGSKPAKTIAEARKYFGDKIDFYVNGGQIDSIPSALIKLEHNNFQILREGEPQALSSLARKPTEIDTTSTRQ